LIEPPNTVDTIKFAKGILELSRNKHSGQEK